jgi:hypothetical protein
MAQYDIKPPRRCFKPPYRVDETIPAKDDLDAARGILGTWAAMLFLLAVLVVWIWA